MSKQTCDGCGIEHDPMDWHAELLHDEYACVREALQTARSKLKAADEAWHEQEDELQALRGKLGERTKALTEIFEMCNEGHYDDMTIPEIGAIALGAIQEPPK